MNTPELDPPRRELCEPCQKYVYPRKRDALGTLNSMRKRLRRGRRQTSRSLRTAKTKEIPSRAYPCPSGNGWHVTSKLRGEDRRQKQVQRDRRRYWERWKDQ